MVSSFKAILKGMELVSGLMEIFLREILETGFNKDMVHLSVRRGVGHILANGIKVR